MDSDQFFTNAPYSVLAVFGAVWTIFSHNWKPLILLGFTNTVALAIVFILLALIGFGFFATIMGAFMAAMSQASSQYGGGRHLIDYSFGSGSSRLLQYYDTDDPSGDLSELIDAEFVVLLVVFYLLAVIAFSVVGSIFTGAFIHTLADIYVGNLPTLGNSLRYAKKKMWTVFCYIVLYGLALTGIVLVLVGIPVLVNIPDFKNPLAIVLGYLLAFPAVLIFSSLMVAAIPSIVIEGKSATEAFGRSYDLCKNSVCFVFCTAFCFNFVVFFVSMLANTMFDHLPGFFKITGHIIVQLIGTAIAPIMNFVVYMTVRVKSENTTQEELSYDIGTDVIKGVEMADNNAGKGSYSNSVSAEII